MEKSICHQNYVLISLLYPEKFALSNRGPAEGELKSILLLSKTHWSFKVVGCFCFQFLWFFTWKENFLILQTHLSSPLQLCSCKPNANLLFWDCSRRVWGLEKNWSQMNRGGHRFSNTHCYVEQKGSWVEWWADLHKAASRVTVYILVPFEDLGFPW